MKNLLRTLLAALLLHAALIAAENQIDWDSAKTVCPGIKFVRIKRTSPRLMRIYVMRIDLETPGLRFVTTGRDPDWDKPMPDYPKLKIRTRRTTTADFMRQTRAKGLNVVVAFNASPWRPWTKPYNHKYADPPGVNISDGVLVGNRGGNPAFVVYKDGSVAIVDKVPKKDFPKIRNSLAGFCIIARNGKVLPNTHSVAKGCHPRTAYGLSADRRYLYIIAIDGRQKNWSLGATGAETGALLIEAGADDAINMDGGGSTTMCYWDRRKKKPVMVNTHNHKSKSKYMRPVANNLGIVIDR